MVSVYVTGLLKGTNIPSKSSQFTNGGSNARESHSDYHLCEVVASSYKYTPDTNAHGPKECNVSLPKQILQVTSIGTCCRNCQDVGGWKPRGATSEPKVFFDKTK
jgi:hypothetical protein